MIIDVSSDDLEKELQDFLEHHGVKGMRWGVRRHFSAENRAANKASRAKDAKKQSKQVQAARDHFNSGKARADYLKAKEQYKKDRETMGSREARKILNKTKQKNIDTYNKSQEAKNGKEVAAAIAIGVGFIALHAVARAAANS